MNRFNNIIKATAILVLSGFVSCVEMEEQGSAVGYLVPPALDVDVTVDDPAQTKAIDFEIEAPAVSDVHFVVKDKDGNVKYSGEGLWSEPLVMPVGAYTVEASAGENGFGKPYFTGSASGSISPLDNEVPALSLALGNALVNVTVHSDFAQHFTGEKVVVGAEALEANFGDWFYVPSGSALALTLSGKNSAGKDATFTYSLGAPAAKTAYSVVCKATSNNWPSIEWTATPLSDGAFEGGLYFKPVVVSNMSDINAAAVVYQIKGGDYSDWKTVTPADVEGYKYISGLANDTEYELRAYVGNIFSAEQSFAPVTYASCLRTDVTAAHNNALNSSVVLESTAVKAAVSASLPAIIAELATSHTASVTFGNGRVKQSNLNVNATKQTLANADGWPYLPQGSYSYTATATLALPGGTHTAALSGSVTVPAPDFSLTLSAYTSYDKYAATNGITKDLNGTTGANNCDPATLYNAGGQWGISTAIMANANYAKTLVINIDGNTDRTFNVTGEYGDNEYYENISSLSWQAHTLVVSVTFDGKTVSKSQTHHITGLPYRAVPPTNTGDHPWTEDQRASAGASNFNWGTSEFYMYDDAGMGTYLKVGTPSFHVPNDIPVSVVISAHGCKHASLKHDVDCRIHSGQSTEDFTAKYNNGNYSDYSINTLSLYQSSPKLQFESRNHTAYRKLYINSVMISYR